MVELKTREARTAERKAQAVALGTCLQGAAILGLLSPSQGLADPLPASPGVVELAYTEVQRERRDRLLTSPISVTDFSALRDYAGGDIAPYDLVMMPGWGRLSDWLRMPHRIDAVVAGPEAADISTLTLFEEIDVEIRMWTFTDEAAAEAAMARVMAMSRADPPVGGVVTVSPIEYRSKSVEVRRNGASIIISRRVEDLPLMAGQQTDPSRSEAFVFFERSYAAMLRAAEEGYRRVRG